MRIHGNSHEDNDLVALGEDLALIERKGFRVIRLGQLAQWLRDGWKDKEPGRFVALTCDDGGDFDFHDLPHPFHGPQRSVLNRLREFAAAHPECGSHITSFVIVSPDAREELDRSCMVGRGWWNHEWWPEAVGTGLMDVASHSWDHNHDALPEHFSHGVRRGTFSTIDNQWLADLEIRRAAEFLASVAPNPGNRLFAYPYGECPEYLRTEYFPKYGPTLGIDAAFGDTPRCVDESSDIWNLPRFICERDWKSTEELSAILDAAVR